MRRSAEDWLTLQGAEIKKATSKHTAKALAQELSSESPKHADSPPENFPVEVVECWGKPQVHLKARASRPDLAATPMSLLN